MHTIIAVVFDNNNERDNGRNYDREHENKEEDVMKGKKSWKLEN